MHTTLEIRLFGGLAIRRGRALLPLPQSRKTRALLAYLILRAAPQRRDALCELFWEIPDDPRGALRWSLSKLRPLVNDEGVERLAADRERVTFQPQGASIDFLRAREACDAGLERLEEAELRELCDACSGELLAGLELEEQLAYESWRLGQQEKARKLQLRLVDERIRRSGEDSGEFTVLLRRRVELEPGNEDTHLRLLAHMAATGHRAEAELQADVSRRMLADVHTLDEAQIQAALRGTQTRSKHV